MIHEKYKSVTGQGWPEPGVVADGSRLHFGPLRRSVKRENVLGRAGKRARDKTLRYPAYAKHSEAAPE